MGRQFAGYIPANRAENFREASPVLSEAFRRLRTILSFAKKRLRRRMPPL
ncbi:MAG: hypothetical protein IKD10_10315 [Lentisphaeria bacterium]|nr:hypothetical protein [Lentisphaeria bacterium]